MSFRRPVFAILLTAIACITGCQRGSVKSEPERFAILRFENMGDPANDWMGRAFSEVIGSELAATKGVSAIPPAQIVAGSRQLGIVAVSSPGVSTGIEAALAAGANRIGYGDYTVRGGRLWARFWIENEQTQKYKKVVEVAAAPGDIIGLASRLAQAAVPGAAAYSTNNLAVLKQYCQALEATNPADAASMLKEAIAAEGSFGPAYLLLANIQASVSRSDAAATIDQALQHASALQPADRARLKAQAATLRGDAAAQQQALAQLAQLDAKNSGQWQALADLAMARRDYAQAVQAYRALLGLQPNNAAVLNQEAYALVYAGDLKGALEALDTYRKLNPQDANALDSRGDVNLLAGHLKEAEESYVQANQLNANFQGPPSAGGDLFKAAMSRLMTGDVPGADALFQKYAAARTAIKDPDVEMKSATWLYLSGRRGEAHKHVEAMAAAAAQRQDGVAEARAWSQEALWKLMEGNRVEAAALAAKAAQTAGANGGAIAGVSGFLSQPSAPADEWAARADRMIRGQAALKDTMLGYALLLDGKAAAAKAPLERARDATASGTDEGIGVLLAWSEIEAGDAAGAAALLKFNPIPPLTGPSATMPLYFPRMFALRARCTTDQREAQTNRELYAKLAPAS